MENILIGIRRRVICGFFSAFPEAERNRICFYTPEEENYRKTLFFGADGPGKTFAMENIIRLSNPMLIIDCNKALTGQSDREFKEIFYSNTVEYFVS